MLYLPEVNVRFERCPRYDNDTGIVCFPPFTSARVREVRVSR